MKLEDNIEKLIRDLHVLDVDTSYEMDQRILHDALMAQVNLKDKSPAGNEPGVWRTIVNNKMTKLLAVAAVIIFGVLIGINQFGGSIAWADVVEQVRMIKTMSYELTLTAVMNPGSDSEQIGGSQRGRVYFQDPGKWRFELLDDNGDIRHIYIKLASGNERCTKVCNAREGKWDIYTTSGIAVNKDELYGAELVWKTLEQVTSEQVMKIGEKVIDGKDAVGFGSTPGKDILVGNLIPFNGTLEVWVDKVTATPIQVKGVFQQGSRIQKDVFERYVMQNIQWNTPLVETLFQLPEGVEINERESRPLIFTRTQLKDNVTVWVGPKGGTPVVTEKDISKISYASIERVDRKYQTIVCFELNKNGEEKLRSYTKGHINEKLLIDFNGENIYEPIIKTEIGLRFIIIICDSEILDKHELSLKEFEENYLKE